MVQKSRLRIALSILSTACLVNDCRAFVSRTTTRTRQAPTRRIEEQQSNYRPSSLFSTESETAATANDDDDDSNNNGVTVAQQSATTEIDTSNLAPIPTEWQGQVLKTLSSVIDPDLGADIVTLGFVQNLEMDETERRVRFDVELTTPACPVKETFRTDCQSLVMDLPFVHSVDVTMTAQAPTNTENTDTSGMAGIGAVIAVSSCKGGVGKSTTSVNLAYALQSMGASVGIFDADVYGPSLPTMVEPDDDIVRFIGRQIAPLRRNGVRLMSFGYINEGSAVMRGPMVSQLLDQFLSVTQWGSLDYLILDMPPGTGDIQLTLTQRLNITAAVIVTTPQELSFADVVRGVEMFDTVNVPCIAVVENMAYYESDCAKMVNNADKLQEDVRAMLEEKGLMNNNNGENKDGENDSIAEELVQMVLNNAKTEPVRIFGPGHKERLSSQWGIEHTYSMPLMDRIAANGDSGTPYVLGNPDSPQTQIYKDLASSVVSEVAKCKFSSRRPEIEFVEEFDLLMVDDEPLEPVALRRDCRCAACVEELTGRQILQPADVRDNIKPLRMASTGNYALSVDWSDGHRSLYPYRQIKKLVYGEDYEEDAGQQKFQPNNQNQNQNDEETTTQQQAQQAPPPSPDTITATIEEEEPPLETVETPTTTASSSADATEEKTCSCC